MDAEQLAAYVELLSLVAEAIYRPAMCVPIRGMPLPPADLIAEWRDKFLAWWRKLASKQLEGTPAELEQLALSAAEPLVRLAKLARRQLERSEATHREVMLEVVEARKREDAESAARVPESKSTRGRRRKRK
jgi:hypothetical protein